MKATFLDKSDVVVHEMNVNQPAPQHMRLLLPSSFKVDVVPKEAILEMDRVKDNSKLYEKIEEITYKLTYKEI